MAEEKITDSSPHAEDPRVLSSQQEQPKQRSSASLARPAGDKVRVHFQAVGSAPIMRKNKFQIGAHERFATIPKFLRKQLRLDENTPLFVYCNSAFCPSPDQRLQDLYQCFQRSNELVLNYCVQEAWG
uniref:Ubiquitin-like protein ATG12 n=1 Tax=Octactis speculum TaxID=3111310 RepID=A0A7S2CZJ6_9STRA|mmetsp:Transcript_41674/g.56819  ORF Transcript_41674/g.56819 Transcript_41674/m.56819 type:complete len:128 (+) Transcript_41674:55-438(+)